MDRNQLEAADEAFFDRVDERNRSAEIRQQCRMRSMGINNTEQYFSGHHSHMCLTIQIESREDWADLVGHTILGADVHEYALQSIQYTETRGAIPFSGYLHVSLLMEEVRPGIFGAILLIYKAPHQQFHDGHIIELEFGQGSFTHQTINRLFSQDRAVVQFMTEYQLLGFLADQDECDMILGRFMGGFNFIFDFIFEQNERNQHDCMYNDIFGDADDVVAVPPPLPVNDFGAIFWEQYDILQNDEENAPNDHMDILMNHQANQIWNWNQIA